MANEEHLVFDQAQHPTLDSHYDRHPARPDNERVVFGEGDITQGADVNEAFSIERTHRSQVADLIAKDGDRLEGADIIVDKVAETVQLTDGVIYLRGSPRKVPEKLLTSVTMTGDVRIGVKVQETVLTAADDPLYYGLAEGKESFNEPGAVRTKLTFSWAFNGDAQPGEFYDYVLLRDGSIVSQDAPPVLSGVQQQIALYDREANGNYIASGCEVSALGKAGDNQVFSIEAGSCNVLGYKITRPTSNRYEEVEAPDLGTVDAEAYTFDDGGSGTIVITTRRFPVAAVSSAIITKETTQTIIKGVTDSTDGLPNTGVTTIIEVRQGATVYVDGTDYVRVGDTVEWQNGGTQPLTGSSYDVTYRYLDAVTPDAVTDSSVTLSGGVTGETVLLGYTFKLPRKDLICLDENGNVVYLKGISAPEQAQPPIAPANLLALAVIDNVWTGTPKVTNSGIRAYPYETIDRMYHKLVDTLDELGLQRLQTDMLARAPGNTNGIFRDTLTNDFFRDAGEVQTAAVFNGSLQIAIDPSFHPMTQAAPLLLSYSETATIVQELDSACEKINPYMVFAPLPAIVTLSPSQDFWEESQTVWLSDQTRFFGSGNQTRVTDTETLETTDSRAIPFLRQIPINFTIRQFGPGEVLSSLTFDNIDVNPGGLVANAQGDISGSFTIPANVTAGRKVVQAVGGSGTTAAATFVGQGTLFVTSLQQLITIERWDPAPVIVTPTRVDPQAQSFSFDIGRHVASIDVKFCAIGDRSEPVLMELVEMDNGFPTTEVIAQTEIDMNSVVANVWTNFKFSVPPYLPPNRLFAFVLKSNDPDHSIAVANRGDFDEANQQWIAGQPYTIGTRFSSSNAQSWTVHQDSDITFRVNTAVFSPTTRTIDLGTVPVTQCSDVVVQARVFLPTQGARVVFELRFEDEEEVVTLFPGQVWERSSYFTGNVNVRAVLTGTQFASPIVDPDILLVSGEMRNVGIYITRAFPMGASVRVDAVMSTKLPTGSTLAVEVDAADDTYTAMSLATASPLDDGFIEHTYTTTGHAAPSGGRLKVVLTGSPAARPSIKDLRSFSI